jgi:CheY-like chemotaxis protein
MDKPKILIAESDPFIAEDIFHNLVQCGYVVPAIVSDTEQAFKQADQHQPDLVLMDLALKGRFDVIETAARIRSFFNSAVVFLSTNVNDTIMEQSLTYGYYPIIGKPFSEVDLISTIKEALNDFTPPYRRIHIFPQRGKASYMKLWCTNE